MHHILDNYKLLVARVDALCSDIAVNLAEHITCSAGCSSCCTSITIFPVEAAAMHEMLRSLPELKAGEIRQHVLEHADGERCPLLLNKHCLLYEARPIICRTHGLPIIYTSNNERNSDCCPLNMTGAESISGSNVVDLDKLNTLLVAVNSTYVAQSGGTKLPERLTLAQAITNMTSFRLYPKEP